MTTIALPTADADLPRFTRELGIPGLADIHVHFLPQRMLEKVWAYFDEAETNYGVPWPITYRWNEQQRLDHLTGIGLRKIPALTYPHKPGMGAWLNQWNAEFAREHPEALHCGTFYPELEAEGYVAEALNNGASLFKVHVQVGQFSPEDTLLDPVWSQLEEAQVPVVIHAGSAPLPGQFTGTRLVSHVLEKHPRLVLVIAHMGMPEYHEFADLAEKYEQVYLDTTLAFTDFANHFAPVPTDFFSRLPALQHKIVLGTDFPNIPHSYAEQIRALGRLDVSDQWLADVLWTNGARLMRLA